MSIYSALNLGNQGKKLTSFRIEEGFISFYLRRSPRPGITAGRANAAPHAGCCRYIGGSTT